jgi:hypothetical protein
MLMEEGIKDVFACMNSKNEEFIAGEILKQPRFPTHSFSALDVWTPSLKRVLEFMVTKPKLKESIHEKVYNHCHRFGKKLFPSL